MSSRRHARSLVDLDLPGRGRPAAPDGGGAAADEPGAPARRASPWARRQAVATLAVLAVVLGTWAVATGVRGHERDARLAAAPGGVLTLERAPAELWSAETDSMDQVRSLPGVVVVRRGTQLVALDERRGTEVWRVDAGDDALAGLGGRRLAAPAATGATGAPEGTALVPWATDGTTTDLRLTAGPDGVLRADGPDGAERWHIAQPVTALLVRAGGVLLVVLHDDTLAGVDLATGETRWTDPSLLFPTDAAATWVGTPDTVRSALTDGERAMLAVPDRPTGRLRLLAVDLADGDVRWERTVFDDGQWYEALHGRPFEVDARAEILPQEGGGIRVGQESGTVTALG